MQVANILILLPNVYLPILQPGEFDDLGNYRANEYGCKRSQNSEYSIPIMLKPVATRQGLLDPNKVKRSQSHSDSDSSPVAPRASSKYCSPFLPGEFIKPDPNVASSSKDLSFHDPHLDLPPFLPKENIRSPSLANSSVKDGYKAPTLEGWPTPRYERHLLERLSASELEENKLEADRQNRSESNFIDRASSMTVQPSIESNQTEKIRKAMEGLDVEDIQPDEAESKLRHLNQSSHTDRQISTAETNEASQSMTEATANRPLSSPTLSLALSDETSTEEIAQPGRSSPNSPLPVQNSFYLGGYPNLETRSI